MQLTDVLLEFDQSVVNMMFTPIYIVFYLILHIFWVIFWPLVNLSKVYWSQGRYRTAVGEVKTNKHLRLECKVTQSMRAHMFEVCIESTFQVIISVKFYIYPPLITMYFVFQPLLQIYMLLPCFLKNLVCFNIDVRRFDFTSLQFFSVVTSVLSLTFSFTKYYVLKQNGAMDFNFNPLSYAVISFSTLMKVNFIIAKLIIIIY